MANKNIPDPNNPVEADAKEKFRFLNNAEEAGDTFQTKDVSDHTPAEEVQATQRGENRLETFTNWAQNYTGAKNAEVKGKKGPLAGIIGLIVAAVAGIGVLFGGPSLMLVHVYETFIDHFNAAQETSLTLRTDRMIASKFAGQATSGVCPSFTPVSVLCRYQRPSNRLLNQMEKYGWRAYAADGSPVKTKGLFPNKKPAYLTFTHPDGTLAQFADGGDTVTEKIPANKLSGVLRANSELRAAFRKAYNPRFVTLADSVFSVVKKRLGFVGRDRLADKKSADKINTEINDSSALTNAVADEGDEAIKEIIRKEAEDTTNKIAKSGKGGATGLIAGAACLIGDVPGLITKTVRSIQMAQVVRYAAVFMVVAAAIKAGDATQEETSALGSALTTVVNGKSGLDSYGMRYGLFGDTNPGDDTGWSRFIPGGSVVALGAAALLLSNPAIKDTCRVATSPVTGGIIDVATSETVVIPLINVAVGLTLAAALPEIVKAILPPILDALPMKDIEQFFVGDLTKNLTGADVGNAFASGASNMMGQTANAGGNMPLTVDQAVAYNKLTTQVQLAKAEEDRATLSPFDATSNNTLLGSFVNQFLPYYSNMASARGIISMVGGIVGGSFATITRATTAGAITDTSAQYLLCKDPVITEAGQNGTALAAGPFCNLEYGIPPEYLDEAPETVLNNLIAKKMVDPETGDIVPDPTDGGTVLVDAVAGVDESDHSTLASWSELCKTGAMTYAAECQIKDQTTAEYALYTIDRRIQQTMDGEDTLPDTGVSSGSESTSEAVIPQYFSDLLASIGNDSSSSSYSVTTTQAYSNEESHPAVKARSEVTLATISRYQMGVIL